MKRSFMALGATAAGFAGVVALHGPSAQGVALSKASSPTTAAGGSNSTTSSTNAKSVIASTTTTATASANVNGTAIGQQENYGYGQMSVKVTIANNHIVDVSVNSIQAMESYSLQLEQQVVPMLKSEVLSAQSTKISAITGATYTSEAYAYSLQSALDQLHFR